MDVGPGSLSSYASGLRCPVLTQCNALPGQAGPRGADGDAVGSARSLGAREKRCPTLTCASRCGRMRMRRQARRTLVGWAGARKSKGGDKDSEKVEEVSAVCFPMTRSVTPPLTVRIRRSGGVGKGL